MTVIKHAGLINKGGHNADESRITTRPPAPAPMRPQNRKEPQMTDRAAVVAKITALTVRLAAIDLPVTLSTAKPLMGQERIDSLDMVEIAMAVEEEFFADDTAVRIEVFPDSSIESIADAVIAQLAKQEAART